MHLDAFSAQAKQAEPGIYTSTLPVPWKHFHGAEHPHDNSPHKTPVHVQSENCTSTKLQYAEVSSTIDSLLSQPQGIEWEIPKYPSALSYKKTRMPVATRKHTCYIILHPY